MPTPARFIPGIKTKFQNHIFDRLSRSKDTSSHDFIQEAEPVMEALLSNDVTELRSFGKQTALGFYNDAHGLMRAATVLNEDGRDVFFTAQVIDNQLLARSPNKVVHKPNRGVGTDDGDVALYRSLLIDIDRKQNKKAGPATDQELTDLYSLLAGILSELSAEGWPQPRMVICSGNGFQAHTPMPIEATEESSALVNAVLKTLAKRFNNECGEVDTKVSNPSRVMRLPGFVNWKGDASEGRTHRRSFVVPVDWFDLRSTTQALTVPMLKRFVEQHSETPPKPSSPGPRSSSTNGATSSRLLEPGEITYLDVSCWLVEKIPFPPEGDRNNNVHGTARRIFSETELNESEVLAAILDWNSSAPNGLPDEEVRSAVRSAASYPRTGSSAGPLRIPKRMEFRPSGETAPEDSPDEDEWGEIQFLPGRELPAFPLDVFPLWCRRYLADLTRVLQTPPDFVGMFFLGLLALIWQKRRKVRVHSGWSEVLVLWVLLIAASGSRKSPAFREVFAPAVRWFAEMKKQFSGIRARSKRRIRNLEAELESLKKAKPRDSDAIQLIEGQIDSLFVPPIPKLYTGTGTPEAIEERIGEHHGRYGFANPESDILAVFMGKYKSGPPPIEGFLSGYSGEAIMSDFRSRDDVDIPEAHFSQVISTQNKNANELYQNQKLSGRGALGRFLTSIPKCEIFEDWVDDTGDKALKDDFFSGVLNMLPSFEETAACYLGVSEEDVLAIEQGLLPDPETSTEPGWSTEELSLSSDAISAMKDFYARTQRRRKVGGDFQFIEEWGGKFSGQVVRIAGLLHLCDHAFGEAPDEVSASALNRAIHLGEHYFVPHAKAAFGSAVSNQLEKVWNVLYKLGPVVKRGDLQQNVRPLTAKDLDLVLEELETKGFLRIDTLDTGGRGRRPKVITLNPNAPDSLAVNAVNAANSAKPITTPIEARSSECRKFAGNSPLNSESINRQITGDLTATADQTLKPHNQAVSLITGNSGINGKEVRSKPTEENPLDELPEALNDYFN